MVLGCEYEKVNFSATAQIVLKKGIYLLWPKLGHAPSSVELAAHLSLSMDSVQSALEELDGHFVTGIKLVTNKIQFAWPFSSLDHGIRVTLQGYQPVFARCAVDALGMSSMFQKSAVILAKTPIHGREIRLSVEKGVLSGDLSTLVSYRNKSCDDIQFLVDEEEFALFEKQQSDSLSRALSKVSLDQALARGNEIFGNCLGLSSGSSSGPSFGP